MRLTLLALVTLLSPTCAPLVAMPADYVGEANHLASAEELNLLYISIPHRHGVDKLNVLASHRVSDTEKYYLLELPRDGGKDFLIADTTNNGVKIYYKSPESPFKDGNAPILDKSMPMRGLKGLFDSLNSVTLKVSSNLQPDDSQWVFSRVRFS